MYNASSFPDKQEDNAESVLNSLMPAALRLALYEPDIPQNTGAILRMAACMGVAVDIIEPCGFVLDDRKLRRAGIAYILQDKSVFPAMTVEENLWMGGYLMDKHAEAKEEAEKIFSKYSRLAERRTD